MNAMVAEVNELVEAARKEILALMKSKGYTQVTTKQSAMYQTDFLKHGRSMWSIDGWHGTGKKGTNRWYGDSKSLFALYETMKRFEGGYVIIKMESECYLNEDYSVEIDAQKQVIADVIKYLKENA